MSRLASVVAATSLLLGLPGSAPAEDEFRILVDRSQTVDGLTRGKLSVNGKVLGDCYENASTLIPVGVYKGLLRYKSTKNFVQGPGGKLDREGDFLVEVSEVPGRKDILFHAGNKAAHATGCIMCGPAKRDESGVPFAPEVLKQMRLLFYDNKDIPDSTPNKEIVIEVR
jgi:hypothetical protein